MLCEKGGGLRSPLHPFPFPRYFRGAPPGIACPCVCVWGVSWLLVYVHGDPLGHLAQDPPGDPPGGGGDGQSSARALNATKRVALIPYACGLALVIGWHAPVLGREGP